jgi:ankyrin repeat protein
MKTFGQALMQGDVATVVQWLQEGVDVNKPCATHAPQTFSETRELPLTIALQQVCWTTRAEQDLDYAGYQLIMQQLISNGARFSDLSLLGLDPYQNQSQSLLHQLIEHYQSSTPHFDGLRSILNDIYRDDTVTSQQMDAKNELIRWVINQILAENTDIINCVDTQGETPFLKALSAGKTELAMLFIRKGADILRVTKAGNTALHYAVRCQELPALVDILLAGGVDLNQSNQQGQTPLEWCLGSPENVLLLLSNGARIDPKYLFQLWQLAERYAILMDYLIVQMDISQFRDNRGQTVLHWVNSAILVPRLVTAGADINAVDNGGSTPLVVAIKCSFFNHSNLPLIQCLIAQGGSLDYRDTEGNTLLHLAVHTNPADFIFLLAQGISPNAVNHKQQTVLHWAVEQGEWDKVDALLQYGADANQMDEQHKTAIECVKKTDVIHRSDKATLKNAIGRLLTTFLPRTLPANYADLFIGAVYLEAADILEQLAQRHMPFSEPLLNEALLSAVLYRRYSMVDWLLNRRANVNSRQENTEKSILHLAVNNFDPKIIARLLDAGADVYAADKNHHTVLEELVFSYQFHPSFTTAEERVKLMMEIFKLLLAKISSLPAIIRFLNWLIVDNYCQPWFLVRELIVCDVPLPGVIEKHGLKHDVVEWIILLAVERHDLLLLQKLLQTAPQPVKSHYLALAALSALEQRDQPILTLLLKEGWDVNQLLPTINRWSITRCYPNRSTTPLELLFDMARGIQFTGKNDLADLESCLLILLDAGVNIYIPMVAENLPSISSLPPAYFHQAVGYGMYSVVERLLKPSYQIDTNLLCAGRTALEVAVRAGHTQIVELLVSHGADVNLLTHDHTTLLHLACQLGYLEVVKCLVAKGDVNKITKINHPLWLMLQCTPLAATLLTKKDDIETVETIINYLLSVGAAVDGLTIELAITKKVSINLLKMLWERCPIVQLIEIKPLLPAIAIQYTELVEFILTQKDARIIKQVNVSGQSALHIAAKVKHNKPIFDQLLTAGFNPTECDYFGDTPITIALYHGTLDELSLAAPPALNMSQFQLLHAQLSEEKEFAHLLAEAEIGQFCFKLLSLFGTRQRAMDYVIQYQNSAGRQPIHDLCLFSLPTAGSWNTAHWAALALQYGPVITRYLHLAPAIEKALGRLPENPVEIQSVDIHYLREQENPELAVLFARYQIPEAAFNRVLDNYIPKQEDLIPSLHVEGHDFQEPRYYLTKLDKHDKRGFVLGAMTHCCQSVGFAGEVCVWYGMTSPYSGFYAIFKRGKDKDTHRFQQLLNKAHQASSVLDFLDNKVTEKSQRNKYRTWCEQQAHKRELPYDHPEILQDLRNDLQRSLQQSSEGELIAQLWAWRNQTSLVFDSWERLRTEDDRLCEPFLRAAAKQAIITYGMEKVLIGKSGNTPLNLPFAVSELPERPADYFDYRDSGNQLLVASQELLSQEAPSNVCSALIVKHSSVFTAPEDLQRKYQQWADSKLQVLPLSVSCVIQRTIPKSQLQQQINELMIEQETRPMQTVFQPLVGSNGFISCFVIQADPVLQGNQNRAYYYLDAAGCYDDRFLAELNSKTHTPIAANYLHYTDDPAASLIWICYIIQQFQYTQRLATVPWTVVENADQQAINIEEGQDNGLTSAMRHL